MRRIAMLLAIEIRGGRLSSAVWAKTLILADSPVSLPVILRIQMPTFLVLLSLGAVNGEARTETTVIWWVLRTRLALLTSANGVLGWACWFELAAC